MEGVIVSIFGKLYIYIYISYISIINYMNTDFLKLEYFLILIYKRIPQKQIYVQIIIYVFMLYHLVIHSSLIHFQ